MFFLQKIFLDTIRLLAKETHNLVDEIWNYMKEGRLLEAAIVLLAAQGQIRGGCLSKRQVNGNQQNGFDVLVHCIVTHFIDGKQTEAENGKGQEHLVEMGILCDCAFLLVDLISQAGEDLDSYIQADSEVPQFLYIVFSYNSLFLTVLLVKPYNSYSSCIEQI